MEINSIFGQISTGISRTSPVLSVFTFSFFYLDAIWRLLPMMNIFEKPAWPSYIRTYCAPTFYNNTLDTIMNDHVTVQRGVGIYWWFRKMLLHKCIGTGKTKCFSCGTQQGFAFKFNYNSSNLLILMIHVSKPSIHSHLKKNRFSSNWNFPACQTM